MITTILSLTLALAPGPVEPQPASIPLLEAPRDAYSELYKEYKHARREYRIALREARQEGRAEQIHAPLPIATFFERFEALAKHGSPEALLFCALEVDSLERSPKDITAFKVAAFERLSTEYLSNPLMEKVISKVVREDDWLTPKQITGVLGRIAKEGKGDRVRSEASYQLARQLESLGTPFGIKRANEIYRFVQESFPESRAAKRCADRLAGLKLAPGNEAPNFNAVDTDGNAFQLSDYRGKVVVLDFWGFW